MLNEVSFKWMVEIYLGNSYDGNRCNIDSHQNHKVNFCLVDADGTYNMSHAVMQSKLDTYQWSGNVQNQCKSHRFDYYFDLGHPAFPYAFLAIQHYTYESSSGFPILQPITVKLILTPLNESQTHIDFVRRKYPDINKVNVIVPGSTFGGQDLTRTSLVVSRHSLNKAFIDETPNSIVFNHHDSPWLECTTTNKISSLLFHVQDEYGQDLKKKTDPNKIIRLTISFADVPKSIINS